MKKITLVAVFVLLALAAFGLQAQDAPTLTYWDTMNDQERVVFEEIANACATEAGVTLNYEYVPFSDAQNNYRTAAQAGDAPDILRTEIAWGPEYAALGYLYDLSDASVFSEPVTAEEQASYLDAPMAYNTWGGRVWGLPQVTDAPALLYNRDLFTQAGLDPDTPPATMDELQSAILAINALGTADSPIYGMATPFGAYAFQAFMWAYGGDLIVPNADGTYTIGVNNAGTIEALTVLKGWLDAGAVGPAYDPANQYGNSMAAFKEGRAGILINGPWATTDVLSGEAFADAANLGVAPIPAGPNGDQGSPVGGHEYTIYAGSQHPNEALAFVRCLNSVENQVRLASELNLVPTLRAAYEDPSLADNAILQGFLAQMNVARNRPVLVAGGQIYTEFGPQYDAFLLGQTDAQTAMDAVAAAWTTLLETEPPAPLS